MMFSTNGKEFPNFVTGDYKNKLMEVVCPICSKEMIFFTKNRDMQQDDGNERLYSIFECESCTTLFQYPFWKPDETAGFYRHTYYAHSDNLKIPTSLRILNFYLKDNFLSKMFSTFLRVRLFPYYPAILKSKNVLDIGCGKGLFLDVMKKYNKKTFGLEPSDQAKVIASKNGHKMIDRAFFYSNQKELKFDLITMFQVAEHLSVQEIVEEDIFSKIYDLLEPGGQLVIETPTYQCDYAKKNKSNWRGLELPRHLVIFSPKSISKMLTDKGFMVNVHTRVSPFDVKETLRLKYKDNSIKNVLLKFWEFGRIALFHVENSSLLTVVGTKK